MFTRSVVSCSNVASTTVTQNAVVSVPRFNRDRVTHARLLQSSLLTNHCDQTRAKVLSRVWHGDETGPVRVRLKT
jgi:hypothetical protein